jgi:tetratricopeptide (TPR) repeat protein
MSEEWQSGELSLQDYVHLERWQEVVRLMAGHVSLGSPARATQLLEEILTLESFGEPLLHRNLLLAGECLGDDVRVRPSLSERIIHGLVDLLRSDVNELYGKAVRVLVNLGKTDHQHIATRILKQVVAAETEVNVKFIMTSILAKIDGDETVLAALRRFVDYPTGYHSLLALWVLMETWPREETVALVKQLVRREESEIAFFLMAEAKVEDSAGWYIDRVYRAKLWESLGAEGLREIAATVREDACYPSWREQGEWILWQLSSDQPLETVRQLATDAHDRFIRCQAAEQLARMEDHEAAVRILKSLAGKSGEAAICAAHALDRLGERALATQILRRVVWKFKTQHHVSAAESLAAFGVRELVVPIVLELYLAGKFEKDRDHWRAVRALTQTCPGELATEMWLDIARQDEHLYRYEAAEALLEANETGAAITALKGIVNRKKEADREKAIRKLIELGKELEIYGKLKKMIAEPCSPSKKYWGTQLLAELRLRVEPNGLSQVSIQEAETTSAFSAKISGRQRLYAAALAELDELIEKDQNNADAWLAKARILKMRKQDSDALFALSQAVELAAPDDGTAIPVLGLFHLSALHISPSGEIQ